MKNRKLMISVISALLCFYLSPLYGLAQDQVQLNRQANKELAEEDKHLNEVYGKVLKKYSGNREFVCKLREAENNWIKFRDKHVSAVFPTPDNYGSAVDMCRDSILALLTNERTKDLNKLLTKSAGTKKGNLADFQNVDMELDKTYKRAIKVPHPDEPLFVKSFQQAQRAWFSFRDADVAAWQALEYAPDRQTTIKYNRLIEMDKSRTNILDQWVHGIEEGDVCAGSRVIKQ